MHSIVLKHLVALRRDGIVRLSGYSRLAIPILQERFETVLQQPDATGKAIALVEPFDDEFVRELCARYFGKPPQRTCVSGRRFLPSAINGYGAFQWHVDCTRPQLKAMLLLTDVNAGDQRMSYRAGTHRKNWPLTFYWLTRFSEWRARWHGRCGHIVNCYGFAGDVWVFDTNGIHRGNRTLGSTRDTITHYYEAAS